MTEFEQLAKAMLAHQRRMDIARRLVRAALRRANTRAAYPSNVIPFPTRPTQDGFHHGR